MGEVEREIRKRKWKVRERPGLEKEFKSVIEVIGKFYRRAREIKKKIKKVGYELRGVSEKESKGER